MENTKISLQHRELMCVLTSQEAREFLNCRGGHYMKLPLHGQEAYLTFIISRHPESSEHFMIHKSITTK